MRFIGNKENLTDAIYSKLREKNISGNSVFDFFSGTSSVAKFFKKLNYSVCSSDILYFSYCLQRAYIKNNTFAHFKKLLKHINSKKINLFNEESLEAVLNYLNNIKPAEGFIYKNYSEGGTKENEHRRMYFSDDNAKIDAIRIEIENLKNSSLLEGEEYFILLACLIESVSFFANISGVYAAFQKKWDKRALKPFIIKPISLICNDKENEVFFSDSMKIVKDINTDILYLDPPYNERQYAPNYHILETIARYDNPEIKGVSGIRNYENQKSRFCNRKSAAEDLEYIINNAKYKYLLLSYSSDGIMESSQITDIMNKKGRLDFLEFDYLKYKSNNNNNAKFVKEQLYILRNF